MSFFLSANAFAVNAKLPAILKEFPREVRLTRHHPLGTNSSKATDLTSQSIWRLRDMVFEFFKHGHRIQHGGKSCETLLHEQQSFALKKYGETEYLDAEEAAYYERLGTNVPRTQVSSLVTSRLVPNGHPVLADIPERNYFYEEGHVEDGYRNVPTAHLWSVSGQQFDVQKQKTSLIPLPWEYEPEWKDVAAKFDRKKYPLVWEWGRAAQDLAGDIVPLYHANALTNLNELLSLRGKIEEGFVILHSLNKVNTRTYEGAFPGTRYASKGEDNVIFLVPMTQVLGRYPISTISKEVREIQKIDPLITDLGALILLREAADHHWLELDLVDSQKRTYHQPIVFNNWSGTLRYQKLKHSMMNMHIPLEKFEAIREYVMRTSESFHNYDVGQYDDVTDQIAAGTILNGTQALEISNVPREFWKKPTQLKRLLVEAFLYELEKVMGQGHYTTAQAEAVADKLIEFDIEIAISTWDPTFARVLEFIGGKVEKSKFRLDPNHDMSDIEGMSWWTKASRQPLFVARFSLAKIKEMMKADPTLVDEKTRLMLREYSHSIEHHLRQL